GAVAHAGRRHRLGLEDLAVGAHPFGGIPGLTLVASGGDHPAEAQTHQAALVVHSASDAGRLDLAVEARRHALRATHCAGELDGQRPRAQWRRASTEHVLAG
ncbi:MAG: hypothetical protein ACK559_25490, partial [bacterium]